MVMNPDKFRSRLGVAKGLGASGHAVGHWWAQRLTALALIPLSIWFVTSLISAVMFPTPQLVAEWLSSPITTMLLSLLVVAMFWHAFLGVQVVIEDYVKCPIKKYGLLISVKFVSLAFAAASILSIMRMHLLDVSF